MANVQIKKTPKKSGARRRAASPPTKRASTIHRGTNGAGEPQAAATKKEAGNIAADPQLNCVGWKGGKRVME